jgi:hypothetical protein
MAYFPVSTTLTNNHDQLTSLQKTLSHKHDHRQPPINAEKYFCSKLTPVRKMAKKKHWPEAKKETPGNLNSSFLNVERMPIKTHVTTPSHPPPMTLHSNNPDTQ